MNNYPKVPCPVCTTKHYTVVQALCCAQADVNQALAKERKLTLVNIREK